MGDAAFNELKKATARCNDNARNAARSRAPVATITISHDAASESL